MYKTNIIFEETDLIPFSYKVINNFFKYTNFIELFDKTTKSLCQNIRREMLSC